MRTDIQILVRGYYKAKNGSSVKQWMSPFEYNGPEGPLYQENRSGMDGIAFEDLVQWWFRRLQLFGLCQKWKRKWPCRLI